MHKSKNQNTNNAMKVMEAKLIFAIIYLRKKELKERLQQVAVNQ